jgi:hypothetical protein
MVGRMICFGQVPRQMGLAAKKNGHGVQTGQIGFWTACGGHLNQVDRLTSSVAPGNTRPAT